MRLKPQLLEHLLHPTIDPTANKKVITKAQWRQETVYS